MNNYTKLALHLVDAANIKNAALIHTTNYDDPYAKERRFNTSAPGRYLGMRALNDQTLAENPLRATLGSAAGVLLPAALGGLVGKGISASGQGDARALIPLGALGGAVISKALGGPEYLSKLMAQGVTEKARKKNIDEAHSDLINNSILGNAAKLSLLGALSGGVTGAGVAGIGGHLGGASKEELVNAMLQSGGMGAAVGGGAGLLKGLINSAVYKNITPESRAHAAAHVVSSPGEMSLPLGTVIKSLE